MNYPHLAARIFNTPLLIHPAKLDAIVHGLGPRFGIDAAPQPEAYLTPTPKREPGGYRVVDGVAVIDVFGVLAHRSGFDANSSYIQGYDGLARQFAAALADPQAKAILLNIDSPGGEVAGAFQLADQIRAARGVKPIHAIAGDLAASAAYLIASAADTLSVTRTGEVGSIGVVMRHVDFSGALAQEGIRVTYIHAGSHKIDGNPYQPLPASVQADLQAQVDHYYGLFVDAVAASRKGMTRESIRATEARMFTAEQAVQMGLADGIISPDALLARMTASARTAKVPTSTPANRTTSAPARTATMLNPTPPTETQKMPTPMTQQDSQALWAGAFQQAHASADPQAEAADALWSHAFAQARGERPPIDTTDLSAAIWDHAYAVVGRKDGEAMPRLNPAVAAAARAADTASLATPATPLMPSAEGQALWKAAFARQGRNPGIHPLAEQVKRASGTQPDHADEAVPAANQDLWKRAFREAAARQ